ncbi:putative porin [Antarcticibacterium sp. 1MA-6-2]|uniref:putative porin n=1 Tax=Antarcticibacterium sp. 1MA-6-2 TaxID=2908210 RepID=UPI001F23C065|nr:putative porin [Antarcticibacterium sp. 1MA-6-2]UJH89799.1 putative porin [Antarcticibacterium sp. 1MA-6-2]
MGIYRLFFLLFMLSSASFAQRPTREGASDLPVQKDSLEKPPITAYKIFTISGDTTYVDTSLTIQKDYRFNYLRKDFFELLPFANVGQTYNRLGYNFKDEELLPEFGARARHFNFMEASDILYYEVPTPLTELYFKTVPEQGQTLDAFFTISTSPRLNFSLAYKGLRSLGKYQNVLTSTGNFRSTINYNTLNERYYLKAHFVSQDLLNQENGGLNEFALEQYVNKEPEFEDRSLLEVKFENAENVLFGKRFFLNQEYIILPGEDTSIALEHLLDFSDKKYIFRQTSPVGFFGESLRNSELNDESKLRHIRNILGLSYRNASLGRLAVKGGASYYNYGYNSVLVLEDDIVANRLIGENYSAGVEYANAFGPISLYGDAMVNVIGDFSGHYFTAGIDYRLNLQNLLNIEINSNERAPNFNFLLNQSDYLNYNWQPDMSNVGTRVLSVKLISPQLVDVEGAVTQVNNYSYFSRNEAGFVKPFQYDGALSYFKLKAHREFHYGRFALDNTVMYQTVAEGGDVFNVPDLVTRNSLYYRDHWFDKALYVQTGFTLKYFTSYEMDAYDPVLAEFFVQNEVEYGGYPVVDFFFNGKVQQTRIFFKLENVNSLLTGNNNFSAPDHPYRDFIVRFGLVWNFFL